MLDTVDLLLFKHPLEVRVPPDGVLLGGLSAQVILGIGDRRHLDRHRRRILAKRYRVVVRILTISLSSDALIEIPPRWLGDVLL